VSLTTRKQRATTAQAAARARAQQAAQQAAQQLGPIAKTARDNAADKIHVARVWAAPRIEQAAHTVQENVAPKVSAVLQENVAPKVSAVLEATAHKLEPTQAELRELSRRARKSAQAKSREVSARRAKLLAQAQAKPARRWPKLMGGAFVVAASIGAVAAVLLRRNRNKMENDLASASDDGEESGQPRPAPTDAEAGFDGQVRTP
jgi:uncharacterized protein (DUF2342 family)